MSAIIRNIVNQAYQLPGIISDDEVADGSMSAMALIKLNELLAQLNIQQLFPYSQRVVSFTIPTIKNSYTIGIPLNIGDAPADIAEERPCYINRIYFYPSGLATPINVQHLELADLIGARSSMQVSGTPNYFAVNQTYPYSEILFDVKPNVGNLLQIVYNASIPSVTINSVLAIPPEYNDLLVTGLARKLCILKQMPAETLQSVDILYKDAVSMIKQSNGRNQIPTLDGLYGTGRESVFTYNAQTDNY